MNWANRLTVGRLVISLIFVAALSTNWRWGHCLGFTLFVLGGVTDYFDGEIARRYGMITDFGKLMDPLVDKIMIASGFICLVPLHVFPAWVAVVVVSREFLITGLRLVALSSGQVLAAESIGKHKTAWQIGTILFFLALLALEELNSGASPAWLPQTWDYGRLILIPIVLGVTLYSGFGYLWRNRALIRRC
jgi:CDP-diacylglycerol--glycerol-3-phosphate 3-phosphatidyltransferase